MDLLVDDVGSFPLPPHVDGKAYEETYRRAREAIISGKSSGKEAFLSTFSQVVIDSLRKKVEAGLDVATYPQHYDMHKQVADVIRQSMEQGTYSVDERKAILPEVHVIGSKAKDLYEETGKTLKLRVCLIGPMELYLKELGTKVYKDILQMFADNVKRFAKNSILINKYVETVAVSLDEPSFGFQEVSADRDTILDVLERAFGFTGVVKQIHLHSPSRISDILSVKNVDVVSLEYAASPRNIDAVTRKMLDEADKQIRVGISRTDINSIMAELYDKGITKPDKYRMVESVETIRKRFEAAREKYGDRMTFTGPDCGLGGWPTQEAAQLLLERTVDAVKRAVTRSV
jgi:5-methyltetrahydropteroyltriglutamate--homocysteine methyltransferase